MLLTERKGKLGGGYGKKSENGPKLMMLEPHDPLLRNHGVAFDVPNFAVKNDWRSILQGDFECFYTESGDSLHRSGSDKSLLFANQCSRKGRVRKKAENQKGRN